MFVLTNHAKLMKFFSTAEEVIGRKKLQKMIYILKKCDVPFEEKYEFHFYGPYSEELSLRVEELNNLGFLSEVKESKSNYYQYRYQLTDQGRDFLERYDVELPALDTRIDRMKERSSRFLELVSTMLYFSNLSKIEVEEKVYSVKKKQNYSEADLEEAWNFIGEMKQIH